MKILKSMSATALVLLFTAAMAGCSKPESVANAKPYPLDTCVVCDMKLSMGTPVTFVYQGQQIKVCDAGEKADFEKDPAKYMKKITDAEAELKK